MKSHGGLVGTCAILRHWAAINDPKGGTELELGMREIGSWQRDVCVCITSIILYKYADMILAITHESFRNRWKPYMHEHELKRIRNTEVYIF